SEAERRQVDRTEQASACRTRPTAMRRQLRSADVRTNVDRSKVDKPAASSARDHPRSTSNASITSDEISAYKRSVAESIVQCGASRFSRLSHSANRRQLASFALRTRFQ